VYECFLVDVGSTLYHCPGVTITLTGRGQIVFTEVGEVTARVLSSGGDFVITLTK
jgi:hypothetical protein